MDKRIIKTRCAIKEAFYQLIAKSNIESVKVTEICNLAVINKTTFYKHYQDVYQLENVLREDMIDEFFDNFEEKGTLISDVSEFLRGLPIHIDENIKNINSLFRNNFQYFFFGFEKRLRDYYEKFYPGIDYVVLTFMISGITRTMPILKYEKKIEQDEIIEKIGKIVNVLVLQ